MTPRRLLFRSLVYHRGIHFAVALGVAVGAAVLSGALLVGDSVRGSLRDLTLDRLGAIDHALVTDRYFREALAEDISEATNFAYAFDKAAPAVLIRGSIENAETNARASSVNIHGVDKRFWSFFPSQPPKIASREIVITGSLAREISARAGDAVLLRFQTDTLVPSESVMGRKSENVRTVRLTIAAVLADEGAGRFGLSASQQLPFNVFLPLEALQGALEQEGRANALLVAGKPGSMAGPLNTILNDALTFDDLNLELQLLPEQNALQLRSSRIVLEPVTAEAAARAAVEAGLRSSEVLTYLANSIETNNRAVPYSTVTALGDPAAASSLALTLTNGAPAPQLRVDEILLNEWAARDLGAKAGDAVDLTYFLVGPQGRLETGRHRFTLAGIVRLAGLAADRDLAPVFKGMSDAARMGDWDPPFPVDLNKIRLVDEEYWERYRTAPKAFVGLETAKKLWTSRFGQITSVRVTARAGQTPEEAAGEFSNHLRRQWSPAAYGLIFQPVKGQGLAASEGATDFSGLFIGFSLFLIVSAAMLVALLFRLGVERRAREIGILLSTGQSIATVRRLLLEEGALVSLVGCSLGLPGAIGYAALMIHGLRTWWSAAVGGSFLELHVTAPSLVGGAVGALLMMVLSIWLAVRKLECHSPRSMLAGALEDDRSAAATARAAQRPRQIAWVSFTLAALLLALSLAKLIPAVAGFFGGGALLLVAALAFLRLRLARPAREHIRGQGLAPLARLGARNGARYPTRSVLSAGLVASATFVIVTVALNRHDVSAQEPSFHSGDGGFRLIAESDVPLFDEQLRFDDDPELQKLNIVALRRKLGEDASCLNLYRPSQPTLLGAPESLIERGGFAFQSTLAQTPEEETNPWLLLAKKRDDGVIPVLGDLNSVQWILHLGLGDTLDVTDGQGKTRRLMIVGLLTRSIFQSQLIMSEANFLELLPGQGGHNVFLIEAESAEAGTLLEEQLADRGFDATRTADRLASYLVVENTYLSTFLALGGLGLLLGTLGLAVVMVRNVIERRSELALLQAVGFNRFSISWLVLAENSFVLVFGILVGTVTALLAVSPHLISRSAEPPWASLSLTLLAILLTGLIAGVVAVKISLRGSLTPALRRE